MRSDTLMILLIYDTTQVSNSYGEMRNIAGLVWFGTKRLAFSFFASHLSSSHYPCAPSQQELKSGVTWWTLSPLPTTARAFIFIARSFFLFFLSSGGWGKIKLQACHTSTYFHTRRVSIYLSCFRNPAPAGANNSTFIMFIPSSTRVELHCEKLIHLSQ